MNYYQYLKLKNLEKPFNYQKEFTKRTKNFGALTNYEITPLSPFSFFREVGYFFGLRRVHKIYQALVKEFGKENEGLINKALSTGLFHIEVLEDFARYYIKKELGK